MPTPQIDPEKLTTEELREEMLKWANGEEQTVAEPSRDENGRFVAKAEEPVPAAAEEEVVYQRVIDLGDGAGVQVFEAPTLEELVDKLAEAQKNATKKIREQQVQIKSKPPEIKNPVIEELTPQQKFLLQQEMANDPVKVINRFVDEAVESRERKQAEAIASQTEASEAFIASNSEYYVSPTNGKRLIKYLETYQLDVTQDNLQQAFEDLNASGLLEQRPADAKETPDATKDDETEAARIEQKPASQTVVRRRVVGGSVSVKRSAPTPVTAPGLTEEQLRKMPMHELEEITRKALMG